MNNKEFDKWINDSLSNLDRSNFTPEWDKFEEKAQQHLTDEEFDHMVRQKMNQDGPAYRHSHWIEYLYRAAFVKLFKVDLLYNKLFEALLISLALFYILPQHHQSPVQVPEIVATADYMDGKNSPSNEKSQFKSESDYSEFQFSNGIELPPGEITSNQLERPISNNFGSVISGYPLNENVFLETPKERAGNSPTMDNQNLAINSYHYTLPGLPINPIAYIDSYSVFEVSDYTIFSSSGSSIVSLLSPKSIENIDRDQYLYYEKFEMAQPEIARESSGINSYQWVFSSFIAADINTIQTPFDEIYQMRGYEQSKFGMGGGFSAGLMKNGWMLELGMLFSMKQYNPQSVLEVFRFRNETARAVRLNSIELNTLSIPLSIRYDLVSSDRWIPHVKLGMGLNLATHANYDREEFILALRAPIPPGANINPSEDPKLDEKKFSDGLLQGGKFSENSYLTANAGLGLDYLLSKNWRVFLHGGYHHNFREKKLGPNNDHINTFSLQMGMRFLPD